MISTNHAYLTIFVRKIGIISYLDNLRSIKQELTQKMDDLRYTFIDELQEFYKTGEESLLGLQSDITETENMKKIATSIQEISNMDAKIIEKDKPLLNPVKIVEEEEQKENQVIMKYNVGDISIDSEDYQDGTPPETPDMRNLQNEQGEQGKGLTESSSKITPRKVINFNTENMNNLSSQDLNESIMSFSVDDPGSTMNDGKEEHKGKYKVKNFTKQRSNFS